jgi:hypothetical protein
LGYGSEDMIGMRSDPAKDFLSFVVLLGGEDEEAVFKTYFHGVLLTV